MNLLTLCQQSIEITKTTGNFIRREMKKISESDVNTKSLNSLVTYVDQQAEKKLVSALTKILPEAGFIAEEGTSDKIGKEYNWIIDPLDGTTNYIHGLPLYSVSIGLANNQEIIMGIIYIPELNECFHAIHNQGAFLNNQEIQVNRTAALENCLIATGFPYYDYEKINPYTETLKTLMKNTRGIRRMGSAAIDLAYVACGRFDSFFEYSLNPWDVAAGSLIVREAGGKVNDFRQGANFIHGKEIIASSSAIHEQMQTLIHQNFYA